MFLSKGHIQQLMLGMQQTVSCKKNIPMKSTSNLVNGARQQSWSDYLDEKISHLFE
jgi:hypothetical protein